MNSSATAVRVRENSSSSWSTTITTCAVSSAVTDPAVGPTPTLRNRSTRSSGGSTATVRSASENASNGSRPGVMVTMNQRSEPITAPRRRAGTRPARTTLDLPDPLGPTSAMNLPFRPAYPSRASNRSISRSRPKKRAASPSSKARRPRYGFGMSPSVVSRSGAPPDAPVSAATNQSTSAKRSVGCSTHARAITADTASSAIAASPRASAVLPPALHHVACRRRFDGRSPPTPTELIRSAIGDRPGNGNDQPRRRRWRGSGGLTDPTTVACRISSCAWRVTWRS